MVFNMFFFSWPGSPLGFSFPAKGPNVGHQEPKEGRVRCVHMQHLKGFTSDVVDTNKSLKISAKWMGILLRRMALAIS